VQRWATSIVATPRTEPWNVDLPEVVGTWPDDDALTAWLQDGADALATTLETADPGLECWAFLKATSPLAMWARRQAHETAIHRVDGESALGASGTPFEPSLSRIKPMILGRPKSARLLKKPALILAAE